MSASTPAASVTSQCPKEARPPAASMSAVSLAPALFVDVTDHHSGTFLGEEEGRGATMPVAAPVMTASLPDNCIARSLT